MIRACIFDLDGTIINTLESLTYAVNKSLEELGYPGTDPEHVRSFIGCGGRNLIRKAVALYSNPDEDDIDDAYRTYKRIFAEWCTYGNTAYEGVPEALREFKARGIKLAVTSNKSQQGVEACIHKVYGEGLFDVIRGERPGIPLKPDPSTILKAAEELGVRPEECIYVGDGETDMEAGRAAGCLTVGVTWGYRPREVLEQYQPDCLIDHMEDLSMLIPFIYVLDGNRMTDKDAFYDEIEDRMTDTEGFKMGHNLDALADVLSGGFGKHYPGEKFGILWENFGASETTLDNEFLLKVMRIMLDNDAEFDCELKIKL
ncbi:MAG: HAD-IA family hydrolase [Lachnospiraceae bacterium]|nr:HAD-IA family hydrolase [Lachnospiraceae bacterium]